MKKSDLAVEKHLNGYNCAQAVLCAFSDLTNYTEDELFRISEAFGGGMGGLGNVCGAVSAMVMLVGILHSKGIDKLPETNKKVSYMDAGRLIKKFESENLTTICSELKSMKKRTCDECIKSAVEIMEKYISEA